MNAPEVSGYKTLITDVRSTRHRAPRISTGLHNYRLARALSSTCCFRERFQAGDLRITNGHAIQLASDLVFVPPLMAGDLPDNFAAKPVPGKIGFIRRRA